MASVTLSEVRKAYSGFEVIHGVDLDVHSGEFLVLVGPSGCGKSTLLRMIAGLEEITVGTIAIGDRIVNDLPASQRNLSMVFQSYALYPHMSVRKNLAFGLGNLRMPRDEIARRVDEAAKILQIEELLERKPRQLSGGQKQRVAIGRAIVREPQLFLFDEPLSNLDAELRVQMRVELAGLYQRLGTTMIYVTHDQIEAMTMATRIVVLNKGNIEHLLAARVENDRADLPGLGSLPLPSGIQADRPITIGVRPEQLTIDAPGDLVFSGKVSLVEYLGSEVFIYLKLETGQTVLVKAPGKSSHQNGQTLNVSLRADDAHYFDAAGHRLSGDDDRTP
jgi:multiple sugar transport system ATP-binding protein